MIGTRPLPLARGRNAFPSTAPNARAESAALIAWPAVSDVVSSFGQGVTSSRDERLLRVDPAVAASAGYAAVAELSTLSLLVPALSVLLHLARFPGLAWLIAAGFLLPVRRPRSAPQS